MKHNGKEYLEVDHTASGDAPPRKRGSGALKLELDSAMDAFFRKRGMSGHSDEWDAFQARQTAGRRNARREA